MAPLPPRSPSDAESIGSILESLIPRLAALRLDWVDALAHAWPAVAGPAVAAHTRPAKLEGHALVIYVDQHVWMQELQRFGKPRLLANIRKQPGADVVQDLRFRLDPGS